MNVLFSLTRLALAAILPCILAGCRTSPDLVIVQSFPDELTAEAPGDDNPIFSETRDYTLSADFINLVRMWAEPPDALLPEFKETPESFTPKLQAFFASVGLPLTTKNNQLQVERFESFSGELSFKGTRLQHKRVRDLLAAFPGSARSPRIEVQALVLSVPVKIARAWGLDGLPAAEEQPAALRGIAPGTMLDKKTFARVKEALVSLPGATVLASGGGVAASGADIGIRWGTTVRELTGIELVGNNGSSRPTAAAQTVRAIYDEPRVVGENWDVSVVPAGYFEGFFLDIRYSGSRVRDWLAYDREANLRTPVISDFEYNSHLAAKRGLTFFAASVSQTGTFSRATARLNPVPECLVLFITPRHEFVPPDWPRPEDYTSGGMSLLVEHLERDVFDSLRSGDTPANKTPVAPADTNAARLRRYFSELGVSFPTGSRFQYLDESQLLLSYNTVENNSKMSKFLPVLDGWPSFTGKARCTIAVARLSRPLWEQLRADASARHQSGVTPEEFRAWLQRIARDRDSELCGSICGLSENASTLLLINTLEVPVPKTWLKVRRDGELVSLPAEFDESRWVGLVLESSLTTQGDGRTLTGEIRPRLTRFLGWAEPGVTAGTPVVETIDPGEIKIDGTTCGRWYVAAAGRMPSPESGDTVTVWFYCTDIVP